MNNSRFNKAIKELHALGMNPQEKSELYARLRTKIDATKAAQAGGAVEGSIPSPWTLYSFKEWMGNHRVASVVMSAVLIVILGGGGAAFAAAGALPGDALYAMKVGIVEPVRGAAYVSADARVSWEAELVATRLSEVDVLEKQGRLDEPKKQQIRALLSEHTQAFREASKNSSSNSASDSSASYSRSSKRSSFADAEMTIQRGDRFIADSDADFHTASVSITAVSATITPATTASSARMSSTANATATAGWRGKIRVAAPALPKATATSEIRATGGVSIPASSSKSSPATTSDTGLPFPHIETTQTVKNAIKATSAVMEAVESVPTVPTAVAATTTSTTTIQLVPKL